MAFLIRDGRALFYHAGDLNDWVWSEEPEADNLRMTEKYQKQIDLLARELEPAAELVQEPKETVISIEPEETVPAKEPVISESQSEDIPALRIPLFLQTLLWKR